MQPCIKCTKLSIKQITEAVHNALHAVLTCKRAALRGAISSGIEIRQKTSCMQLLIKTLFLTQAGMEGFGKLLGQAQELPGGGQPLAAVVKDNLRYEVAHRDVILKWGRFPHRNRFLGRESSEEEERAIREGTIPSF